MKRNKHHIATSLLWLALTLIQVDVYATDGLKFVVIGHTDSTLPDASSRKAFFNKVNEQHPDYVFILGDSDARDSLVYAEYMSGFHAKVFFSPGNHDTNMYRQSDYLQIVGYLDTTIIDPTCNFILFNSLESADHINKYLASAFAKCDTSNPTVLLTHHRVWDDNLLSEGTYMHDKSYLFKELMAVLDGNADYIFAGNSSAQYFARDQHVVYWVNMIRDMACYAVGMKFYPHFTLVNVDETGLYVQPKPVYLLDYFPNDSIARPADNQVIEPLPPDTSVAQVPAPTTMEWVVSVVSRKSVWAAFIMGVMACMLLGNLIRRKRNRD